MEDEYFEEIGENGRDITNDTEENTDIAEESSKLHIEQLETTENMDFDSNIDNISSTEEITSYTFSLIDEQYQEIHDYLKIISHTQIISIAFLLSILVYIFLHNMLERRKI